MEKTIRVLSRKVTPSDGRKPFYAYKHYNEKSGEFFDVKFTQDAGNTPKQDGYFAITFKTENANIKNGKKLENGFVPNATLWIQEIVSFARDTEYEKQLEADRIAQLDKMF